MGVVTTSEVGEDEIFGPIPMTMTLADPAVLIGHRTCDTPPDIHSVKIDINQYREGKGLAEWAPYIQAARDHREQNMEAYLSSSGQLYYRTLRKLSAGSELFIWYSDEYAAYMGVPPVLPAYIKGSAYICPYCMESFKYPNSLRAHLRFKCKYRHHVIMAQKAAILATAPLNCVISVKDKDPPEHTSRSESPSKASPPQYKSPESPQSSTTGSSSPCRSPEAPGASHTPSMTSLKRTHEEDESPPSSSKRRALSISPRSDYSDHSQRSSPPGQIHGKLSPSLSGDDASETRSAFQRVDRHKKEELPPNPMRNGVILPPRSQIPSIPTSTVLTPNPMNMAETLMPPPHPYQMLSGIGNPRAGLPMAAAAAAAMLGSKMGMGSSLLCGNENAPIKDMAHAAGLVDISMVNSKHLENNNIHQKMPFPGELNALPQGVPYVYRSPNPMVDRMLNAPSRMPMQSSMGLAQNWCAKCNATFRMTSDLVYHMRSHHKREFDPVKKKRDDKLRCDVCGETFRERHHLTRHMTSHA